MEEEVIQEYRSSLEELTANSKPLINMLTMLAEDNEQYAPEIVKVIETHLQQVYLNFIFNRVSI
uniref:CID domain-containing protein n=1 Tax=Magallana gigas TaxID=29159 RepID=A0A8W8LEK7_MAGGI